MIGRLDYVKLFIENEANVRADDDFALRFASYYGHLDVVKFLIENGANICAQNNEAFRWASVV